MNTLPTRLKVGRSGFTIVELLIVIVVIGVLAAITVVAFSGIQKRADDSAIFSKETQAKKALESYKIQNDNKYPPTQEAVDMLLKQTPGGKHYVLYLSPSPHTHYALSIIPASGPVVNGAIMQTINNATCPIEKTRVNDARDNTSYWIKKLPDGKCWMLTNLAYAGGGTNTYSDVRTINQATSGGSYTSPQYYTHSSSNPTVGTTNPSSAGDQYGYYYNWCGAMGGQSGACTSSSIRPSPNQSITVCPAGWRLPTGGTSGDGEFSSLDRAFGGTGLSSSGSHQWTPTGQFMAAYTGYHNSTTWWYVGSHSFFWSSSPHETNTANVSNAQFTENSSSFSNSYFRYAAISVRCLM